MELDFGPWGTVISCVKSPLLTGVDVVCILWKSSLVLTYLFSQTFRGPIPPPGAAMSGRQLSHLIHQRAAGPSLPFDLVAMEVDLSLFLSERQVRACLMMLEVDLGLLFSLSGFQVKACVMLEIVFSSFFLPR